LFWSLTPNKLKPFISAYEAREKRDLDKKNYLSWINGIYVSHAVYNVLSENGQYPKKPFSLFEEENTADKANDAELFGAYAAMFNKQFKEKAKNK